MGTAVRKRPGCRRIPSMQMLASADAFGTANKKSAQPAWPHGNEALFPTKNKNISFRSRSWQDTGQLSEDLTYSDQPDITVTDSRGFSPHSTCKHEACANYPIFNCCYYSTKSHKYKYHFPVYYVDFYIASSENRNKL